ncbi:peptidyl-tRNA hydrolase [Polychytrium aggregatum]|uniref:peptidyl-tRNA hydrolase n=1 Tax=Polychytrium aggregatum TaxID=110093 RepID=UPI0022FE8EF4|nr:peptidyl-tRNA hydrolase [Polychytrium aggregatum]KAI9203004.1 peptidyl-tRNA hydrolase [Polychytrium aggregatum]
MQDPQTPQIDYVVVGLGNTGEAAASSRHNAGFLFCDYLSNCIHMQQHLLATGGSVDNPTLPTHPPRYVRRNDLGADINDTVFTIFPGETLASHSDVAIAKASKKQSAEPVSRTLRLLIVKPIWGMNDSGVAVRNVLLAYNIANPSKQLIVAFDDLNTLPGSIAIHTGTDLGAIRGHKGVESIVQHLGNSASEFIRFRLGIGRPHGDTKALQFVDASFQKENRELDLFGYALDLTAQALQYYFASNGDSKSTKKKFGKSKKLPLNKLQQVSVQIALARSLVVVPYSISADSALYLQMESLSFPFETVGV